nr:unnamed protein product [Callosobruchus analis]
MDVLLEKPKPSMADRKAELERKKARLAALREEKDRRRREKELKDVEEAAVSASTLPQAFSLCERLSIKKYEALQPGGCSMGGIGYN